MIVCKKDSMALTQVEAFIKDVLDGKIADGKQSIELPEAANRLAEQVLGHPIKNHSVRAEEIRHAWNNHGEGGSKPFQIFGCKSMLF